MTIIIFHNPTQIIIIGNICRFASCARSGKKVVISHMILIFHEVIEEKNWRVIRCFLQLPCEKKFFGRQKILSKMYHLKKFCQKFIISMKKVKIGAAAGAADPFFFRFFLAFDHFFPGREVGDLFFFFFFFFLTFLSQNF